MDYQNRWKPEYSHLFFEIIHIFAFAALKATLFHFLRADEGFDAGFEVYVACYAHT
jgi:hypothetical protein